MSEEKSIRDPSRKVDIGIISRHVVRMKVMLIVFRIKRNRQGSTCTIGCDFEENNHV